MWSNRPIRVFLDTNILVDIICEEQRPSYDASSNIFQLIRTHLAEGFITTQSIIDAEYIFGRQPGNSSEKFRGVLLDLLKFMNVEYIDSFDIRDAIKIGGVDFEDDALFAHAESKGVDVLVTSDRKFIASHPATDMLVMTPEDFMAHLKVE